MNTPLLDQCTADAFSGAMTFGETIGHMMSAGVEWYSANLIIGGKTHYAHDGAYHQLRWPIEAPLPVADHFDADQVVAALRAIQAGEIAYPEFLRRIAEAGVAYYTVHMRSRRAIYFGRDGDSYVEPFPPAPSEVTAPAAP